MSAKITRKSRLRQLLSLVTYYSGVCLLRDALGMNRGARILCYHSITETPQNDYAVSIADFDWQMSYLAGHCQVVTVDELVSILQDGLPLPANTVAVTVDDGFEDFYTHAFPILKKYRLPAAVFLPTGLIDGKLPPSRFLPAGEFLTWDQVRELHSKGIDFGSHTVTHATLVRQDALEVQHELERSKLRIERELGAEVHGFAYPYGTMRHVHPRIERAIAEAGYRWALTTFSGPNQSLTSPFELRRVVVSPVDGRAGFKRLLKGALDGWWLFQTLGYYLEKIRPGH